MNVGKFSIKKLIAKDILGPLTSDEAVLDVSQRLKFRSTTKLDKVNNAEISFHGNIDHMRTSFHKDSILKCMERTEKGVMIKLHPYHLQNVVLNKIHSSDGQLSRQLLTDFYPKAEKVVVEFSSPNIAKQFHAGHLRSTLLGNFISNLNLRCGHDVVKINYLGDWGTQFGLLGVEMQNQEFSPSGKSIQDLLRVYVQANRRARDEGGTIRDSETFIEAQKYFRGLEEGCPEKIAVWKECCRISLSEYQRIYDRLGIHFDVFDAESHHIESARSLSSRMGEENLSESCGDGLSWRIASDHKVQLLRRDGTTLYLTRDVAALIQRFEKYRFDRIHYVVEHGQAKHFEELAAIMQILRPDVKLPVNLHVGFGRIAGLSSRMGAAVLLDDLLDEATGRMQQRMDSSSTTRVSGSRKAEVAERLAISAIVVQDLSSRRMKQYRFDWDGMLRFSGHSGVALQYAHARLCSMERTVGVPVDASVAIEFLDEEVARALIRHLASYEQRLQQCVDDLEPRHLTHYLFALCDLLNIAWRELNVRNAPHATSQARFLLFNCCRLVLSDAMKILGINPLSEM